MELIQYENLNKVKMISFEQWCITNSRLDLLNRWDYDLNELNPDEIGFSSHKESWFNCPCGIHKSELKRVNNYTRSDRDGSIPCNQCNSIGQWLIDNYGKDALELYWSKKNILNPYNINYGSSSKIWIICQNCGNEKQIKPEKFVSRGLSCSKCSDGVSYGEKIMFSVLQQLNLEFQTQLSKTTFKWCESKEYNYRYDFYFNYNGENIIIEIHGIQHYKELSNNWGSFLDIKVNDNHKRETALLNGIKKENYVIINCSKSEQKYIKDSIMNSILHQLFDLSNINWLKCHEYACKSLVKEVCNLWNIGMNNILHISDKTKLCKNTVREYLKQGAICGWCCYNSDEEFKNKGYKNNMKVYCLELDKFFDSIKLASLALNIGSSAISKVCKSKLKSSGKHPETGESLHWMYYEDYLKLHNKTTEEGLSIIT